MLSLLRSVFAVMSAVVLVLFLFLEITCYSGTNFSFHLLCECYMSVCLQSRMQELAADFTVHGAILRTVVYWLDLVGTADHSLSQVGNCRLRYV